MSRNTKIILVVLSTLALICVLLCVAVALLTTRAVSGIASKDPAQAKRVASQIADYTLPPGYQELMGSDLFYEKVVAIGQPGNQRGLLITLMQVMTPNTSREEMEAQMRQVFGTQIPREEGSSESVGERTVTIKGQPTVLSMSESTLSSGKQRQAIGVFSGKGGVVMMMISGPVDEWDWKMLDDFFQSIH